MAATYNGTTASKPPVSRHPAFPAIVALWFAALLGVGSLVLPVTLLESLVVATGLPTILPAAEPPLGISARILIALVGGGLGAIIGLWLARKVATAQNAAPVREPRAPASLRQGKRPISAREELGAESFDEPVDDLPSATAFGRRRRFLATGQSSPGVPLGQVSFPDAGTEIVLSADMREEPVSAANEALDLAAFADTAHVAESSSSTAPTDDFEAEPARTFDAAPATPRVELAAELAAKAGNVTEADSSDAADHRADQGPLHDLSLAELVDRFALALQRAAERTETESPAAEMPARYVPDLGVEVAETPRLAADPVPTPDSEDDAGRRAAASAMPVLPEAMPAALRPLELDDGSVDDEDDDLALTLSLTPDARPFAGPPVGSRRPSTCEDEEGEEAPGEDAYSSLLSIGRSEGRREVAHFEEDWSADEETSEAIESDAALSGRDESSAEPAATPLHPAGRPFDAPAGASSPSGAMPSADPAQAERALRDALHKLQRLSGAA